ncbi:hypothetical protein Tco_1002685 [Tanacetum coccineum]|uniref:BTB domain-containing protein n=1 Tax=Tanacetum coccineum TaxID=301880 RepID=A0ABQ5F996_9ASTR
MIALVKVRWDSKRGPELTWERKDQMRSRELKRNGNVMVVNYVPEIFMQQFWYSIKKVQGTDSYEFLLANKKCTVNAEVFRTILDICPRVEGVDFTDVPDDDIALTFLIDLGYKAIINKCLSGKMASNDKLGKSRIDILWGMFERENVNYPELIWEGIAYHIDHKKEKRSRRENMPYPRFTKIIINHFLKQHKSLTNLNYQYYHTIKDDGIVMVAPVISILSDTSEESVGSHAPRVILFGAIPTIIPTIPEVPIVPTDPIVASEVGTVSVVSPSGVLDLVDYSPSSYFDPSEDSLPPVPDLPLVSPFLCSDNTEANGESEPAEQRPVSSSRDTIAPLSEFPLAP